MQLPPSLTELNLGDKFNHPLMAWNPPVSLTSLTMPSHWKLGASQLRLPPNLTQLTLPPGFNDARESLTLLHLPSTLHTLRLDGTMKGNDLAALTLPHSLTSLDLGYDCDASLDDVVWPPHLTRLVIGQRFNQPLLEWSPPSSLTELILSDEYGSGGWYLPLSQLRLPSNLHKLTFGSYFDQPLTGFHFPSSLRVLCFGRWFNQSLTASAWTPPPNLEELDLTRCWEWDRPWTDLHLPPTLRKLTLPDRFNQPIENEQGECELHLPDTLVELRFDHQFNQSLRSLQPPASLRLLSIPCESVSYSLDQLPLSLPSRLERLVACASAARVFQSHPIWPDRCVVKCC